MFSRLLAITFDAHDPDRVARFWAGVLGRQITQDTGGLLVTGQDTQIGLRFAQQDAEKVEPNRMHLHLTSINLADQQHIVANALRLGASHLDVGQQPEDGHIVLADPQGNEFCVIEPGNSFLAGCGLLGELACDGTRDVGLFWSKALGWPLVWVQSQETAIQLPQGGTKLAWGGPPVAPKESRNRQRFELIPAAADPAAELDRLIALGATPLDLARDGAVMLGDPDGNEFCVRTVLGRGNTHGTTNAQR